MFLVLVKWIHILAAITAVGANITYGVWIARASGDRKVLPFVLRNIRFIDNRVANPCYGLLLLTGLMMAFLVPIPITTPWLLAALILYVAAALLGVFGYSPVIKRQIQVLDGEGSESPNYEAVAKQGRLLGIVTGIDVIVIVFLMVVKPALWG
jgi:uncharacterized membrane protein